MAVLNIVLVEPQIPQNTGNIARTCAATGAALHIVKPIGFTPSDTKLKRAGLDYWHLLNLTYHDSLTDFFACTEGECFYYTTKGTRVYSDTPFPDGAYLLFGREDAGLPEELLVRHPERCLRIPMAGGARSLNLSNTVAVAVYEVLRQWDFPALTSQGQLTQFDWNNWKGAL